MSRLGGSVLLLFYLVTTTPLAPVLTALLAATERNHYVALQTTARGIQVVLRHDCVNLPSQRHGLVARGLTVFAQRTTATQSDHVIQFGITDTSKQTPAFAIEAAPGSPAQDAVPADEDLFHAARLTALLVSLPRPPPGPSGFPLTIRSTVLVL